MSDRHGLHVVTPEENETAALRAAALARFEARYRHNPESRRTMRGALDRVAQTFTGGRQDARTFAWELLADEALTEEVWGTAERSYSRNTAVRDASALRVMLECCERVGLLTYEEYRHARSFDTRGVGKVREPAGTFLTPDDVVRIVRACLQGPGTELTRIRDAALVLTMAGCGARRLEIGGVRLQDAHLSDARLWLGHTKGGRPRDAYLHPTAVDALTRWITARGPEPGPLFVPLSRSRPLFDRGALSDHQMWKVLTERARQAGLGRVTPHDMRRFLISNLLETVDVTLLARVVGHKRPSTTAQYDRRPAAKQRDAVATLSLPMIDLTARS
ncbi:tyrosine-type recombinase/integrase [Cellulomonas triticagri]|nr:site-specific integrase [Cellulomonas triticagri]